MAVCTLGLGPSMGRSGVERRHGRGTAPRASLFSLSAQLSSGKRIDASMTKLRTALFYNDMDTTRKLIAATKKLSEAGGDWDRRNRLKVPAGHMGL